MKLKILILCFMPCIVFVTCNRIGENEAVIESFDIAISPSMEESTQEHTETQKSANEDLKESTETTTEDVIEEVEEISWENRDVPKFSMPENCSLTEFDRLDYSLFIEALFEYDDYFNVSDTYNEYCILDNQKATTWELGIEKYIQQNQLLGYGFDYSYIQGEKMEEWQEISDRELQERIVEFSPYNDLAYTEQKAQNDPWDEAVIYREYKNKKFVRRIEKEEWLEMHMPKWLQSNSEKHYFDVLNQDRTVWTRIEEEKINIYRVKDKELLWQIDLQNMFDSEVEPYKITTYDVSQLQGDEEKGFIVIGTLGKAYKFTYPGGEVEELGNYMYYPCVSPDEKYVAYSVGGNGRWRDPCWEDFDTFYDKAKLENMQEGIYVKELETGRIAFVPFTGASKYFYELEMNWVSNMN